MHEALMFIVGDPQIRLFDPPSIDRMISRQIANCISRKANGREVFSGKKYRLGQSAGILLQGPKIL